MWERLIISHRRSQLQFAQLTTAVATAKERSEPSGHVTMRLPDGSRPWCLAIPLTRCSGGFCLSWVNRSPESVQVIGCRAVAGEQHSEHAA